MRVRKVLFAGAGVLSLGLLAAGVPATAAPHAPRFTTVKLAGTSGSSEPRVTVDRHDVAYVVTNGTTSNDLGFGLETVFRSADGLHWKPTEGQPGDQDEATTDVDIVSMHTGRILTSELDYAGINFRTQISDDGGRTWKESTG